MPERRNYSQEEKRTIRAESDAELIREGAKLIYNEKNQSHIEVTEEQIERARKEMEEELAVIEKEKALELKAAISVEEKLKELVLAVQEKDVKKINRIFADLLVLAIETRSPIGIYGLERSSLLEEGNNWFNISHMLGRLKSWLGGSEIPMVYPKGNAPKKSLKIEEVLVDNEHEWARDVRNILKEMADPQSCLTVQKKDGTTTCPNCDAKREREGR